MLYIKAGYEKQNVRSVLSEIVVEEYAAARTNEERTAILNRFAEYAARAYDRIVPVPTPEKMNDLRIDFVRRAILDCFVSLVNVGMTIMTTLSQKIRAFDAESLASLTRELLSKANNADRTKVFLAKFPDVKKLYNKAVKEAAKRKSS